MPPAVSYRFSVYGWCISVPGMIVCVELLPHWQAPVIAAFSLAFVLSMISVRRLRCPGCGTGLAEHGQATLRQLLPDACPLCAVPWNKD